MSFGNFSSYAVPLFPSSMSYPTCISAGNLFGLTSLFPSSSCGNRIYDFHVSYDTYSKFVPYYVSPGDERFENELGVIDVLEGPLSSGVQLDEIL